MKQKLRIVFLMTSLFSTAIFSHATQQSVPARAATGPSEFKLDGAVKTPLVVTAGDMKQMARTTVRAVNTHSKKTEVYEGVPLALFLAKAGLRKGKRSVGR